MKTTQLLSVLMKISILCRPQQTDRSYHLRKKTMRPLGPLWLGRHHSPCGAATAHHPWPSSSLTTALKPRSASPTPSEGGGRRPTTAVVAQSRVAVAQASIHTSTAAWARSVPLGLDPLPHDLPAHTERRGILEESCVV
jgi:hypothetical protein